MKRTEFPRKKSIGLLLDPDKASSDHLTDLLNIAQKCKTDYILAGGSITFNNIDTFIDSIRSRCNIPIILFPGNLLQISLKADKILLLSLISGRNPELLIGNHVIAAPFLRDAKEKIISTGYILISCGTKTSVEYISQTNAIPSDKPEIAAATALAGEMLGMKMIYLEAGSGATTHVPIRLIEAVKENISVPLAVGGGIRTKKDIENIYNAGADLIILGNGCEKNPELLIEACLTRDEYLK